MDRQRLEGFYQVARLGGFSAAAQATGRTQSAVSQQVRALEDELGCRLLERTGRAPLRLTPAGELVMRHAESLAAAELRLRDDLRRLVESGVGRVSLAAPYTTLYHLLPPYLESFIARHPHVELTLLDRRRGEAAELVARGQVDVGLAPAAGLPPGLRALRWRRVWPVLIVPKGHPLLGEQPLTWEKIARHPLILPPARPDSAQRRRVEAQLGQRGLSCRVAMESGNVELSSLYVEKGLGICFATVAEGLPLTRGRNLALLRLDEGMLDAPDEDHLCVLLRAGAEPAPAVRALVEALLAGGPR